VKSKLTYSNVVATLALFLSLGAGAYAAGIGRNDVKSRHIANDTIRSVDVRDKGLYGRDIHEESLGFKEIREDRLDVNQFAKLASDGGFCDPTSPAFVTCNAVTVGAEQTNQLLIVATGGQESFSDAARGVCRIVIDGHPLGGSEVFPGERVSRNTDALAQNGFALTQVTSRLGQGPHTVALQCSQGPGGDVQFSTDLSVLLLDAI